jgi:hypothetical protein
MTKWEYRFFHISNQLVIVTGLVYGWMRYCMTSDGEFSVVNHPWQPHFLHAHIIVVPLLIFCLGHFWGRHIWANWTSEASRGRRSGSSMLWVAVPMIISGYCIQVSVSEAWRNGWIIIHVAVSLLWALAYVVHWVRHRLSRLPEQAS